VLVGLPGAGKTTVGRELARRLGWRFCDVDEEIVARTGATVEELFNSSGEAAFRDLEARLTAELSSLSNVVLAPGGGWAAQPGSLESLPEGTALIWLRVSAVEALRRLRGSPVARPLLAVADPAAALATLAQQRTRRYECADLTIDVDGRSVAEIVELTGEWLEQRIS
jgi:shikimate kinase